MGKTVLPTPENCPDPSVHGNPFRYCPYCSWIEAPEQKGDSNENPTLPSPNSMPPIKRYNMSLSIATEYVDLMYRETFICAAEVQVEKLARAMVEKMVEEYDERHKKQ